MFFCCQREYGFRRNWSLWSIGTWHCFSWRVTLHANLCCFLKNFLFFFFFPPLPSKIEHWKENIHFWQLTLLGHSIFEVFFVGSVVKITDLLCCGISVMCFCKSWPKLSFWLEEIFSHAVYWIPNSAASNFIGEEGEPDTRCSTIKCFIVNY